MTDHVISEYLEYIRENLWDGPKYGKVSIIVGSGFSRNADPIDENIKMPLWKDLAEPLIAELYPTNKTLYDKEMKFSEVPSEFLRIAQKYEATFGRPRLLNQIENILQDNKFKPGETHKKLLELPWAEIFTTNYDTLLERANSLVYEYNFEIVRKADELTTKRKPRIVKLHGSLPSGDYILTEEDYRTYNKKYAPFVNTVRQALIENIFCLIGFSGNDPNFNALIGWVRDQLQDKQLKIFFIDAIDLDEPTERLFYEKNIVYLNLKTIFAPTATKFNFTDLYIKLFEYFSMGSKKLNPFEWSSNFIAEIRTYLKDNNQKIGSSEYTDQDFRSLITILQKGHETYPGWVILPFKDRKQLLKLFFSFDYHHLVENQKVIDQIEFAFEYSWLHKLGLVQQSEEELEWFNRLINSIGYGHPIAIEEGLKNVKSVKDFPYVINQVIELLLVLLLHAMERIDLAKYDEFKTEIQKLEIHLSVTQKLWLAYLDSYCQLILFNKEAFIKSLSKWPDISNNPEWLCKKAGVLMEMGEDKEALLLAKKAIEITRNNIAVSGNEIQYLSLESVCLYVINSLEGSKDRKIRIKRSKFLSEYKCNIYDEIENLIEAFSKELIRPKEFFSTYNSFDASTEKIHYSFGQPAESEDFWFQTYFVSNFWRIPFVSGLPMTSNLNSCFSQEIKSKILNKWHKLPNSAQLNLFYLARLKFEDNEIDQYDNILNRANLFVYFRSKAQQLELFTSRIISFLDYLPNLSNEELFKLNSSINKTLNLFSRLTIVVGKPFLIKIFNQIINMPKLLRSEARNTASFKPLLKRILFAIDPKDFWLNINTVLSLPSELNLLSELENSVFFNKTNISIDEKILNDLKTAAKEPSTRYQALLGLCFLHEANRLDQNNELQYIEILFSVQDEYGIPSNTGFRNEYLLKKMLLTQVGREKIKNHFLTFNCSEFNLNKRNTFFNDFSDYANSLIKFLNFFNDKQELNLNNEEWNELFLRFVSIKEIILKQNANRSIDELIFFEQMDQKLEIFNQILNLVFAPRYNNFTKNNQEIIDKTINELKNIPNNTIKIILAEIFTVTNLDVSRVHSEIKTFIFANDEKTILDGFHILLYWYLFSKKTKLLLLPNEELLSDLIGFINYFKIPGLSSALKVSSIFIQKELIKSSEVQFIKLSEAVNNLMNLFADASIGDCKLSGLLPTNDNRVILKVLVDGNSLAAEMYKLYEKEKITVNPFSKFKVLSERSIFPEVRNIWVNVN